MLPNSFKPMLASMGEPFDSPDFLYEIKWDGYRCLAFLDGATRLQSRNLNSLSLLFPELSNLHHRVSAAGALIDGEIVALRNGLPSFQELQKRAQLRKTDQIKAMVQTIPVVYIVFDLLFLKGQPIYQEPLTKRRLLLEEIVTTSDELILASQTIQHGQAYFKAVSQLGLEGVIAKQRDSAYFPGKRVKSWLKFKNKRRGNFIICGYVINPTTRGELSSLVLGAYQGQSLKYYGLVGTGFTQSELKSIQTELQKISCETAPFPKQKISLSNACWIWTKPLVVCEVEFLELTDEGSLRHPSFQSFRPDLRPIDCQYDG